MRIILLLWLAAPALAVELPAAADVERFAHAVLAVTTRPTTATAPLPATVVTSARGTRYHRPGCRSVGVVWQASGRPAAEARGLTPCRRCLGEKKERAPRARGRARGARDHEPGGGGSPTPGRPWDSLNYEDKP